MVKWVSPIPLLCLHIIIPKQSWLSCSLIATWLGTHSSKNLFTSTTRKNWRRVQQNLPKRLLKSEITIVVLYHITGNTGNFWTWLFGPKPGIQRYWQWHHAPAAYYVIVSIVIWSLSQYVKVGRAYVNSCTDCQNEDHMENKWSCIRSQHVYGHCTYPHC